MRRTVIDDQTPFIPLVVPRASGELTELEAKQVKIGARRYIGCRNLAEARRDAEQREAILGGLRAKLAQGDKALVGNSGFRRYLKTVSAEHFAIDEARVADDARFDGLYVLRTNSKITPLQVMLRYRDLLRVEQLLLQAKAVLATRPIYHNSDMAIPAMSSVPSLPCCSSKNSKIASAGMASPPNGATFCAISIGCRKSSSIRMASASCCAPRPPASPVSSFRQSVSPCRPIFRKSRCRTRSRLADPPASMPWC